MKVFIAICLVALVYAEDSDKENIDLNVRDDLAAPYRSDIVAGRPAGECEFPSIVSLKIKKGGRYYMCGGTLIDATHVLTAAHCIAGDLQQVTVSMGFNNARYPKLKVNAIYAKTHKKFYTSSKALRNDIAMLTLDEPVPFDNCIQPIPLAHRGESFEGRTCIAAGWGKTVWKQSISANLRKVPIPIMSYGECHKRYRYIGPDHICAGDWRNGGPSPCQGDSGGPLYCKSRRRWVLAGMVSFGLNCEDGLAVYTNVAYFRDWIDRNHIK